jgi:DNA-binding GntR family transcriptional regulator
MATSHGRKNAEQAYEALREKILNGDIRPGDQVLETEAAEALSMSRTPVREAMVRLEQEGIVSIRPRHGMRVLPVSADDMREIYLVLTALEGTAVRHVAEAGVGDEQIAELRQTIREMDEALGKDDRRGWAAADQRFHQLIVEYSGNKRLQNMVRQVSAQAHQARMATLFLRPSPESSTREHEAVIDAIMRRDPETARHVHELHRKRAGEMLSGILEKLGRV